MQAPKYRYGDVVRYQGYVWRVWSMCTREDGDVWYHDLIRGVPVGRCTDGSGLVHSIARDTDLEEVDEANEESEAV